MNPLAKLVQRILKYPVLIRCIHRIKMENTSERPTNNELVYINGELFHENKSIVDGTHVTQTHVITNTVIILSNKLDMLDKGTIEMEQKIIIDFEM